MNQKRILVTGGAGYIGSQCCKELKRQGYEPVVYDNLVYGHRWAVKWGPLVLGDIHDTEMLVDVIREHEISAVMHFAAYAYVGESVSNPAKYYQNNITGTLRLLEALRLTGVRRFVFSSTCAIYGIPGHVPIVETDRKDPINPYGRTKLMVESILEDYEKAYGINSICLRYFNAAGCDPDGEIGERHDPETHLIPLLLEVAQGKREFFSVFGDDYPTPDGSCVRDFIHVKDLAAAHILALEALQNGGGSNRYNLGTGEGFSVLEIIEAAGRVLGREIPYRIADRRPGDPPELIGDGSKINRELGWKVEYSSIETILESHWRWLQKGNS